MVPGGGLQPGANRHFVWDAEADWNGQFSSQVKFNIIVSDSNAPAGMALIPAGNFQMGNSTNAAEGANDELPVHTVYVSAIYMDKFEVTKALWNDVRAWGLTHGYTDLPIGSGKEVSHPVQTITWYSMVKWCNARSEKEGVEPVYYTNDVQTVLYRTGNVNVTNAHVKWSGNGYRLPTEAEWEKAARSALSAQRFPWGATIMHSQANYRSLSSFNYDVSVTRGHHPTYAVSGYPYTSPVGSFSANGYGLYDMAGNVFEWCWDVYGSTYYSTSPSTDPHGPLSGGLRVLRGGDWSSVSASCRSASRNYSIGTPSNAIDSVGFRCVRR